MKVAIIGSRTVSLDIAPFVPQGTTEIISGGANGIDTLAEKYADEHNIAKTIIKPDYSHYGRVAPLKRNDIIVEKCDKLIAIWDGISKGTMYTVKQAQKANKPVTLIQVDKENKVVIKKLFNQKT